MPAGALDQSGRRRRTGACRIIPPSGKLPEGPPPSEKFPEGPAACANLSEARRAHVRQPTLSPAAGNAGAVASKSRRGNTGRSGI